MIISKRGRAIKESVLFALALLAVGTWPCAGKMTIFGTESKQNCHSPSLYAHSNQTNQQGEEESPTGESVALPDLAISDRSIVPSLVCNEDGRFVMSVRINAENLGALDVEKDFKIRIQDNAGNRLEGYWHNDFDGPLPLPSASGPAGVSIHWPFTSRECSIQFSAALDTAEEIPEVSEENNAVSFEFPLRLNNIRVASLSSTSSGDGVESLQVVVENTGCGIIDTPFILSVEDNTGNIQRQTIPSLPPDKHTTTFDNWPSACSAEDRTFTIIADAGDQICELDGADNTLVTTLANTNPDLAVAATVAIDCQEDGKIRGSFKLVVTNAGQIDIQKDFFITIDDGKGWRIEKQFGKEMGGRLPIKKGETREVTVDWTRDFSIKPMIIDYPDLSIVLDSKEQIDECDPSNNELSIPYSLQVPNLNLLTFTPTCVTDDYYQVILVIENNGGADITQDFAIQITDNDGHKQVKTFTEIEGTLPFKAGTRETVLFDTWKVDQSPALLELECRLDVNRKLAETDANDNNKRGGLQVYDMEITDFRVGTNSVKTEEGESLAGFFTITVTNSGLSPITDDFTIQVVDREGWRTEKRFSEDLGGVLPLAPANSQSVIIQWDHDFTIHPPVYTFKNISVIIDSQSDICECDGTNNQAFTNFHYSNDSLLLQIPLSH